MRKSLRAGGGGDGGDNLSLLGASTAKIDPPPLPPPPPPARIPILGASRKYGTAKYFIAQPYQKVKPLAKPSEMT